MQTINSRIPKEKLEPISLRRTDNTMVKRKRAAREAIIDKTLHKKLLIEIEQHEHHKKTGLHLGGPEGVKFLLHKLGYKHTIENV
jgi:hypothetical protein